MKVHCGISIATGNTRSYSLFYFFIYFLTMKNTESIIKNKISKLEKELVRLREELTKICEHVFVLHQVVGEGRYCCKCGFVDTDFDD